MTASLREEVTKEKQKDTDFPDAEESWKPLISVYEKASYEAAMEDFGGGGGFLLGVVFQDHMAPAFVQPAQEVLNGEGLEVVSGEEGRRAGPASPGRRRGYDRL